MSRQSSVIDSCESERRCFCLPSRSSDSSSVCPSLSSCYSSLYFFIVGKISRQPLNSSTTGRMSGGGYKSYGVGGSGSGSGGGGSSAGYQSTGGGDASSDFSRISHTIGNNIQKISQNISSMQRMVNQLGTPQDSDQLRNQL